MPIAEKIPVPDDFDASQPLPKDKMEAFCREYLIDLNGAQAAIRAGYKENSCRQMAGENLNKPIVRARIKYLMDQRSEKTEITAEKVLLEIARMAFASIADYVRIQDDGTAVFDLTEINKLPENEKRAALSVVSEITTDTYMEGRGEDAVPVKRTKFKLSDKTRNLELLGKHLVLFSEKLVIDDKRDGITEDARNKLDEIYNTPPSKRVLQ